ncbi:hypothetical protein L6R52_07015 [Myxococcota bacterium]|nr:hypothetical protein [Myxococcota bacterium]
MKTRAAIAVVMSALALSGGAEAVPGKCKGAKKRLLILGIQSEDDAVRGLLGVLNAEYAASLQATGCFDLMAVSDLSLSIKIDGLMAEFGCNDDTCRTKLDQELRRADLVASGELRSASGGHFLSLILLDAVSRTSLDRYGPTPTTRSEIEHLAEIRKGVGVLVGDPGGSELLGNVLAVPKVRDPANNLEGSLIENLTTVLYVELAQSPLVTLVPRDRMQVLEETLRDPKRVAQEARARYLLKTEILSFSKKDCGVAAELYDLHQGVTRLATQVRGGCSQAERADSAETLARQIIEILTPPEKSHLPVWLTATAAIAGGTVGTIFLLGAIDDVGDRNAAADPDAFSRADAAARDKVLISNIGFGAAGVAAAAGLAYLLVEILSDGDAVLAKVSTGERGVYVRF